MTGSERERFDEAMTGHLHGAPEEVAKSLESLESLLMRSGADEFLVTTSSYDRAGLLGAYRLLAGIRGRAGG